MLSVSSTRCHVIDHISIAVSDLSKSVNFYQKALAPLGMLKLVDMPERAAFGSRYPEFWLNARPHMRTIEINTGAHLCLRARTASAVDEFHAASVANGGTDDGAPGLRQATQVIYYAAFIRDPDGNRLEVMTVSSTKPT
jgi:catechol 2,3-dioxygenase-like lactoylglutathione lyase family enzyme